MAKDMAPLTFIADPKPCLGHVSAMALSKALPTPIISSTSLGEGSWSCRAMLQGRPMEEGAADRAFTLPCPLAGCMFPPHPSPGVWLHLGQGCPCSDKHREVCKSFELPLGWWVLPRSQGYVPCPMWCLPSDGTAKRPRQCPRAHC